MWTVSISNSLPLVYCPWRFSSSRRSVSSPCDKETWRQILSSATAWWYVSSRSQESCNRSSLLPINIVGHLLISDNTLSPIVSSLHRHRLKKCFLGLHSILCWPLFLKLSNNIHFGISSDNLVNWEKPKYLKPFCGVKLLDEFLWYSGFSFKKGSVQPYSKYLKKYLFKYSKY